MAERTPAVADRARRLAEQLRGPAGSAWTRLGGAVIGLGWLAEYALLRLIGVSKRATVPAVGFGVLALLGWLLLAMQPGAVGPLIAALAVALLLQLAVRRSWRAYHDKLIFLAEAHPRYRAIHLTPNPPGLRHERDLSGWELAVLVAGLVLLAAFLGWLWNAAGPLVRSLISGLALALLGVTLLTWAGALVSAERRHRVGYFVRGWRAAEPLALEARLRARHPGLAPYLIWRQRLTDALHPWLGGLWRALARPADEPAG